MVWLPAVEHDGWRCPKCGFWETQAPQAGDWQRSRQLAKGVLSKSPETRAAAIEALVTEPRLALLMRLLERSTQTRGPGVGRSGTSRLATCLGGTAALALVVGGLLWIRYDLMALPWAFILPSAIVGFYLYARREDRMVIALRPAVDALKQKHHIGVLTYAWQDPRLRYEAERRLVELLPTFSPEEAGELDKTVLTALAVHLSPARGQWELTEKVAELLGKTSRGFAVRQLRRLASPAPWDDWPPQSVRDTARDALQKIEARVREEAEAKALLRAVSPEEAEAAELLRAARASSEPPEQLLRAQEPFDLDSAGED
jgi:hypothetical protein